MLRSTKDYLAEKKGAFAHLHPRGLAYYAGYSAVLWGEGWLGTYLAVERCRDKRYELEDSLLAREQEAGEEFLRRVEVQPHEEFDHVQFLVEHRWDVATAVADFTANQLGSSQLLGASVMMGMGASGSSGGGRGSGVGSEQDDVTGSGSIAGSEGIGGGTAGGGGGNSGGVDWSSLIVGSKRVLDECIAELVVAEEKHATAAATLMTGERYQLILGKAVSVTSCCRALEHAVLACWDGIGGGGGSGGGAGGGRAGAGAGVAVVAATVQGALTAEHLLCKLCKNVASSARRKYVRSGSRLLTARAIFGTSLRADALVCCASALVEQVHTTVAPVGPRRRAGVVGYAAATVYHACRCAVSLVMAACGAAVGSILWPGHGTAAGQIAFSLLVDPLVDKMCTDFKHALNVDH